MNEASFFGFLFIPDSCLFLLIPELKILRAKHEIIV